MATRVVVVDTETTGLETTDQVVEIATVELPLERGQRWWSSLVRPSCPVSAGARGVHHIGDEELAEAPTIDELVMDPKAFSWDESSVLVAHNLEFDVRMLLQSGVLENFLPSRRICTYRCALHLWPDAESHKNQSLRYSQGLVVPEVDGPPHRALPDAVLTAALVSSMIERLRLHALYENGDDHVPDVIRDRNGDVVLALCKRCGRGEIELETPCRSWDEAVDELVKLTEEPVLLKKVPFGKYRGQRFSEMDEGFLRWILGRQFGEDVMRTARHHLAGKTR